MENNNELEMMRAQVALLKEKLDKEQMVSERMMRTVIKKEMGSFSRDRMLLILLAAAVMPFMLWMLICHDRISVALAAAMELYMITAVAYTFYSHRGLDSATMGSEKLVTVGRRLVRVTRLNALWLRVSIPVLCVIVAWMFIEFGILEMPLNSFAVGGITGFCVGLCLGIIMYRKKKRALNELIQQIEELTDGQPE